MKVGDKVKILHPGKRNGEIGVVLDLNVPLNPCNNENSELGVRLDLNGEDWLVHSSFVESLTDVKRSCQFIESENIDALGNNIKSIFIPNKTSDFDGWERHQWLKKYFGKECVIVGPELWNILIDRHGPASILIEDEGIFRVEKNNE